MAMEVCVEYGDRRFLFVVDKPEELHDTVLKKFSITRCDSLRWEVRREGFGWVETDLQNIRDKDAVRASYHPVLIVDRSK